MKTSANSPDEYIRELPEDRREPVQKLRETILNHLPEGFTEIMNYGMIGYVVPKSLYPDGYHCDPKLPLPFINLASQKAYIALYHMGMYANEKLLNWFISEYPKRSKTRLDMGKSCIRFKKTEMIPFDLVAELVGKMSVKDWIDLYESKVKN